MSKVLLISGSPRQGNTENILHRLKKETEDSELVLLRDKKIQHCIGCMKCKDGSGKCVFRDDMDEIIEKLKKAALLIIGSPNYYENTPGLLRDFIDRTHPLYTTKELKNKMVIFIFVGGGETSGTDKFMRVAVRGFVKYSKLNDISYHSFQALNIGDIENNNIDIEIKNILQNVDC